MKYIDFERVYSHERLYRYVLACNNNKQKAMYLYRYNLKLSKEMFAIIGCFEVALRNGIDVEMKKHFGDDWLRDSVLKGGFFYKDLRVAKTRCIIENTFNDLANNGKYTHSKLITELGFGIWKYMFNNVQYSLSGKCLLKIFPNKEKSTLKNKYNNTYLFNELEKINILRNRIAHHEPICISHPYHIDIIKVTDCYKSMIRLFEWMDIDYKKLLYGIDHVECMCKRIKNFQKILKNNYTH